MDNFTNTPEESQKSSRKGRFQGVQLVLVQCSVCILALLIIVALKFIGGDAYNQLQSLFRDAMVNNHVFEGVLVSAELPKDNVDVSWRSDEIVEDETPTVFYPPLENGILTSAFGSREDPFDTSKNDVHYGVDIAASEGTTLAALLPGEVIEVGYQETGYGHYLIVACDNGYSYVYAHCSKILAEKGERVTGGQAVALVGNTGRSTGSHVHIEWRKDDNAIDPMAVLPQETYV